MLWFILYEYNRRNRKIYFSTFNTEIFLCRSMCVKLRYIRVSLSIFVADIITFWERLSYSNTTVKRTLVAATAHVLDTRDLLLSRRDRCRAEQHVFSPVNISQRNGICISQNGLCIFKLYICTVTYVDPPVDNPVVGCDISARDTIEDLREKSADKNNPPTKNIKA